MLKIKSMFSLPCVHVVCTSYTTSLMQNAIKLIYSSNSSFRSWLVVYISFFLIDQAILYYLSNGNSCVHCHGFSSHERLHWTACALYDDAKLSSQLRQQWCSLTVSYFFQLWSDYTSHAIMVTMQQSNGTPWSVEHDV